MAGRRMHSDELRFNWGVVEAGYALSDNGKEVRALGGMALRYYCPDNLPFPLHLVFTGLVNQVVAPGKVDPDPPVIKRTAAPEFWQLRFSSLPEAWLSFVTNFGFLFNQHTKSEEVERYMFQYLKFTQLFNKQANYQEPFKTSPKLTPRALDDFNMAVPPEFRIHLVKTKAGIEKHLLPGSLIGWIWHRVAMDLCDSSEWSSCAHCKRPMVIGGGHHNYRKGSRWCSNNCRILFNQIKKRAKPKRKEK